MLPEAPSDTSPPNSMMPSLATRFFDSSSSATLERSTITSQVATNGGWILNMTQTGGSSEHISQPPLIQNPADGGTRSVESGSDDDHAETSNKTRAQVYFDCLLSEKRGSPLYIPSPDRNLPKEYRQDGVRPGDVVVINDAGGVSYFFNVFASADDPINRGRVPPSFRPFPKYLAREEKYPYCTDVVMSSSIRSSGSNLGFETSREGALVVMPSGANLTRLANTKRFEKYIERHLESWYHFVLTEGVPIENGDIRLVVGCDKTTNWGMATFLSQERIGGQVVFQRLGSDHNTDCTHYTSQCSGSASAQTGPKAPELDDLREAGSTAPIENQCLFLQTLNPHLSEVLFEEIAQRVEAECFDDWDTVLESNVGSASTSTTTHYLDSNRVLPGSTTKGSINHPSSAINKLLLGKFPSAKMVITEDDDWASVIRKEDQFPSAREVVRRIENNYRLSEHNGVVTISPLDTTQSNKPDLAELLRRETVNANPYRHTDTTTLIPVISELSRGIQNLDLFAPETTAYSYPSFCFTMSEPQVLTGHAHQQGPSSSISISDDPVFPDLDITLLHAPASPHRFPPEVGLPQCDPAFATPSLLWASLLCDTNRARDITKLFQSLNARIEDIKVHKKRCRDISDRCGQLLLSLETGSIDTWERHSLTPGGLTTAVEKLYDRASDWATWSTLKSYIREDEIKNGIDQFDRDLDDAVTKSMVQSIPVSRKELGLSMKGAVAAKVISRSAHARWKDVRKDQNNAEEGSKACGNLHWLNNCEDMTATSQPLVGAGSFNTIYKGSWLDQEYVAIRRPRTSRRITRLDREIAIWNDLNHMKRSTPQSESSLVSVVPWIENGNLEDYIRSNQPVDQLKILTDIASGLEYLQSKGIIHGDLRGANVLVSETNVAKLADFGVSIAVDDSDGNPAYRKSSVRWVAPELLRGNRGRASTTSDVWSLGAVCYALLTGNHPEDENEDSVNLLDNWRIVGRPRRMSESSFNGLLWLMQRCWSPHSSDQPPITLASAIALLLEMQNLNPEPDNLDSDISYSQHSMIRGSDRLKDL